MQFSFAHNNFNVRDLDRSLSFYREALGLTEVNRIHADDGSFIIVYLGDGVTPHQLELTWLRDWGTMSSISPSAQTISQQRITSMHRWGASVLRTPQWASTLSPTRTDIGWRSSPANKNRSSYPTLHTFS